MYRHPQKNEIAERKNRHLLEVAWGLLFTCNVPKRFWGEAILTTSYLINKMPSYVLKFKFPYQLLLEKYHNSHFISYIPLKIFGCTAFVHIHQQNRSKLDPRSLKCIFLGYPPNQKGHKCFSPEIKRFYISIDVTFLENQAYFPNPNIQGEITPEYQSWNVSILEIETAPVSRYTPVTPSSRPAINSQSEPTVSNPQPKSPVSPAALNREL